MKSYFLVVLCAIFGFCLGASATTWIMNADEITEEWLVKTGFKPETDRL